LLAVTQVLVRREGALGQLTLNRPEALNALSPAMIRALAAALDAWERDDEVAAVLLDGAGTRGLCAGGDVRFLYDDRGGHASAVLLAEAAPSPPTRSRPPRRWPSYDLPAGASLAGVDKIPSPAHH
jgi:enoyl-CoA hydratase/carnithine racemase